MGFGVGQVGSNSSCVTLGKTPNGLSFRFIICEMGLMST